MASDPIASGSAISKQCGDPPRKFERLHLAAAHHRDGRTAARAQRCDFQRLRPASRRLPCIWGDPGASQTCAIVCHAPRPTKRLQPKACPAQGVLSRYAPSNETSACVPSGLNPFLQQITIQTGCTWQQTPTCRTVLTTGSNGRHAHDQ